jgi:hypothetical protein
MYELTFHSTCAWLPPVPALLASSALMYAFVFLYLTVCLG